MTQPARMDELFPPFAWLLDARPREAADAEQLWQRFGDFARSSVAPRALKLDRCGATSLDSELRLVLADACRHRLFSATIPVVYGGLGLPLSGLLPGLEELAAGCVGIANLLSVHGLGLALVGAAGNLDILGQLCLRLVESEARGEPELIATAVTEPSAGTDAESIELLGVAKFSSEATPSEGGYVLNGSKVFISNGHLATHIIVLMPTDRRTPATSLKAFWVQRGTAGFSVERLEAKMGQRACPAATLVFDDCFVPEEACIGSVGGRELDLVLGSTRGAVAAYAAGVARAALETTMRWARSTRDGAGNLYVDAQWVKLRLADMQTNLWLARATYWMASAANERFGIAALTAGSAQQAQHWLPRFLVSSRSARTLFQSDAVGSAARLSLDNLPDWKVALAAAWGASAKVGASDLAVNCAQLALEIAGGRGLRHDMGLEKLLRDARLLQIYEGTNDLNRLEIFAKTTKGGLLSDSKHDSRSAPALDLSRALVPHSQDEELSAVIDSVERWLVDRAVPSLGPPEDSGEEIPDAIFVEFMQLGVPTLTDPGDDGSCEASAEQAAYVLAALGRHLPALGASTVAQWMATSFETTSSAPVSEGCWLGFPLFDELWAPEYALSLNRETHRIEGDIPLVVNASLAEYLVLPVRIDGEVRDWCRISPTAPGVHLSDPVRTLGLRGCRASDVHVEVARSHYQLGHLGTVPLPTAPPTRARLTPWAMGAGLCLGILESSAHLSQQYAGLRLQGGRPIANHDAIATLLADLATDLATVSAALSTMLRGQNDEATELGLTINLRTATLRGTDMGIQALGGYGYLVPYRQERRYRDARQAGCIFGRNPLVRLRLKEILGGPR